MNDDGSICTFHNVCLLERSGEVACGSPRAAWELAARGLAAPRAARSFRGFN